MAHHTKN